MDINCFKLGGATVWTLIASNLLVLPYGHYFIQIWLGYHSGINLLNFDGANI